MKDPAVLFYISDWLTSTSEMDSDCKGWYLNLILHNYDKGSLPNDIEKLAVLAGVKFSEFKRFEQVFEQVLKQKFELIDELRISNLKAQTILKSRECFKDKRSDAGKKSYLMKYFAKNYTKQYKDKKIYNFVNLNIDTNIDTKNQTEIEHMFKHLFELYINENVIVNEDKIIIEDKTNYENELQILIMVFNETFKTNYTSIDSLKNNYYHWRKIYEPAQMEQAIINVSKDQFWKNKMTPTILFRQKNSNKESVDYIGQFLNLKKESTQLNQMGDALKESLIFQLNKIKAQ